MAIDTSLSNLTGGIVYMWAPVYRGSTNALGSPVEGNYATGLCAVGNSRADGGGIKADILLLSKTLRTRGAAPVTIDVSHDLIDVSGNSV